MFDLIFHSIIKYIFTIANTHYLNKVTVNSYYNIKYKIESYCDKLNNCYNHYEFIYWICNRYNIKQFIDKYFT